MVDMLVSNYVYEKVGVGKINGCKWVGAAAERRRFFQATRRKNFLSNAKKKPSDDEA